MPEPLLSAIRESKKCNPEILAKTRTDTLKQWAMRAKALESEEERFKSGLHPDVAKILAPKRLLLWKELMARYSYPDTGVFDLITSGVSLTGEVENSGLFNSVNKPATLSVQQLREEADNITDETLAQVRPQSPEIDQTVLRKTLQEVENGWLTGPIPRHLVPAGSVVCRRFGLCQGEKTRLIDDMRPVNQTVSTFESPRPHTVDVLAAMGRELMSACPGVSIQGKAFDLTAAYRQLPLHPDAAWVSFISIWDCERKEPALFRLKALPFGASKSVYSFLRTSHSLWWLACKALSIVWTLYYDDFVCVSSKALASHTDNCVRAFFFLLGWKFSLSGDKHMDFAEVFTALGVTIHLADCLDGRLTICNTAKRTRELVETIGSVLQGFVMSKALALKLRGRMQFAEGQLFGRAGRLCLRAVSDHAYNSLGTRISSQCRRSLVRFAAMLQESTPRTVRVEKGLPWHVYTDASYNAESSEWPCGVGGVLLNPAGRLLAAFSACLPKWFRALLGEGSKETIIFEAELVALICAMRLWKHKLQGKPVLFFVDNNSARDVAISGAARSAVANRLLDLLLSDECSAEILAWYQRVPSPSNVADHPSKRLGSSSMFSGSDSRGRAQPWQKSTEPQALISTREKCCGRLKTAKSKNGKTQDTAKPALSKKVQDSEGCSSPYRTMIWSKEDWSFSTRNSPSARFAIWSANTSRKRSLWQVYGLCMLALLVSTWVLSATPHALQSWEKASLASGMRIWDEPYQQVQFGRGPAANSDRESACKRVAANVGRRDMTRFCVAVQVGWNTCLDSCHHCDVCSRCLFAPCLSSHRTWPARIPLPAVWEQTRHRHRMAPQRMPLRMFFNSRTVASSCFRRQPGGFLMRCSNGLHRSKLHTSLTPISTWKSLSRTIRYHETPCKGRPQLGSHPLRDAKVEGGRIDRRLSAWSKQEKRPPRWYMTDSCLKGLRPRTQWAMRREVTWHKWTKICGWVPFLAPLRSQVACLIEPVGSHTRPRAALVRQTGPVRVRILTHQLGREPKCMGHP